MSWRFPNFDRVTAVALKRDASRFWMHSHCIPVQTIFWAS
jgi:hypothetical protein